MLKTFKLRPKADHDLQKIYTYSVKQWGDSRAEQYIQDIETAFHTIAKKQMLGRDCDHISPSLRAFSVVSHIIFYKPDSFGIAIIRVLHKSMDEKHHI